MSATLNAYREHEATIDHTVPRLDEFRRALLAEERTWNQQRTAQRRWSSRAAIAAMLLIAAVWYSQTEVTLDAEGVIARTLEHERHHADSRSTSASIRKLVPSEKLDAERTAQNAPNLVAASRSEDSDSLAALELAQRLAPYGFDLRAPLSARHFQQWRSTARIRTDRLLPIDGSRLKLSTTTAVGAIREAEIVVLTEDYEPIAQRWEFADGFAVEVTKRAALPVAPTAPPVAIVTEGGAPPVTGTPPPDLDAIELETRSALQDLGAPIGRHVRIQRQRNRLHIEGTVSSKELLRQVMQYASSQKGLRASVSLRHTSTDWAPILDSPGWRDWLDHTFGNSELRSSYPRRAWELLDDFHDAVAGLQNLAERYPISVASGMSPGSQHAIQQLAERQYRDCELKYEHVERHLAALIGTISRPALSQHVPADWRDRAARISDALERTSQSLSTLVEPPATATMQALVATARDTLRPALEVLADRLGGEPPSF